MQMVAYDYSIHGENGNIRVAPIIKYFYCLEIISLSVLDIDQQPGLTFFQERRFRFNG
jgi:hypothetical protein